MNPVHVLTADRSAAPLRAAVQHSTGIRVAVAVGDTLIQAGVRHLLSQYAPVFAIAEVPTGASPLAAVWSLRPDVLVLDTNMLAQQPPMLAELSKLTRVIVLCDSRDTSVNEPAVRRSVARILVHGKFSTADFVRAVTAVAGIRPSRRTPRLSTREADVMRCIAQGMRNPDIATTLTLTPKTVKNHINRIFAKLGAETRSQALLIWLEAAA